MRKLALAVCVAAAIVTSRGRASADGEVVMAQDTKGTPDERAEQLLQQMTQEEKISLLSGSNFTTHKIERLGIPGFEMSDGPQGVRNGPGNPAPPGVAYPCGAALAATWDVELAAAYGKAVGLDGRARGTHFQLGPGMNICRVPVNGRNFEYFGEDPYLAGAIAAAWVKNCSAQGVVPTIKHFAANNQETARNSEDSIVDERTMHEIYLPAFRRAVQEGGVISVMCSYNRLNGSYASNNDWLLNQVLKQDWGFKGLVMSDWGASHQVTDLARGLDLEMPSGANLSQQKVAAALADGRVKQADIDNAARRFLRTAAAMGWLDKGWVQKNPALPLDSEDSARVALQVAESAMVLLKNEGQALPLEKSGPRAVKNVIVVGPNATAADGQLPINCGGGGSGAVTPFPNRFAEADYLKGIIKAAGDSVKVTYLPMPGFPPDEVFARFAFAHVSAGAPEGLTLKVQVTGDGEPVSVPDSVQKGIVATWMPGQLPLGVPAGRDATYTWSGVLMPDADGDWEIRGAAPAGGNLAITLDGKEKSNGEIVHLAKGAAVPISVELRAVANPPAGRRGGGGRGGAGRGAATRGAATAPVMQGVRLGLVRPSIPDLAAAKGTDALIVCVGLNRNTEAEGRDRPFELPPLQKYLINAAVAANPRTIIVNNSGAAVEMEQWASSGGGAAAIVQAYYLGQEGGIAVGRMLFGDVNPSGRLCSTFDRAFEENPAFANYPGKNMPGQNYPTVQYEEGIFYGYRGYDKAGKAPRYPFGYGLSYTQFSWANIKVDKAGEGYRVSLDVKNTGSRAGADVVEIYLGEQGAPLPRPVRELKGFTKVTLGSGASRRVEVALSREAFGYWSPEKKGWVVDFGKTFVIEAGGSERDIRLKENITLN